jgi:transcriptional regulator with XRE-family HTH domain
MCYASRVRFSARTVEAVKSLGLLVAVGRRERRWTLDELAERAGTTRQTLHRIERGEPTVALGTYIEVAGLVGVDLLDIDRDAIADIGRINTGRQKLTERVRRARVIDDDF